MARGWLDPQRLRRVLGDARRFGWQAGSGQVWPGGSGTVRCRVPGIGDIHARTAGSDLDCLRYVFGVNPFDTRFLPALDARIGRRYDQIRAAGQTPVILDAGANIGATALWFARRYPDAVVVAVEPDPGNVAMLRRNCEAERNVVIVAAAIGSAPGHAAMSNDESWAIQAERSGSGVRIVTVDEALGSIPKAALFIAKINIEGFESDLFAGNLGWLDQVHTLMIEPHDWLDPGWHCTRTLQQAMAGRDFEMFIRDQFLIYARVEPAAHDPG